MRILHVTHELPPYEAAGTAIYTLNIARAQALNHDVFVFARLQDPDVAPYRTHVECRDRLAIRFMNLADISWSPFESSYVDERAERIFHDYLDEVEPDIVHFQHILGFGQGVLRIVREMGIPTVFTLHDFWTMCPMGQRMSYVDDVICDTIDFAKCGPCVFGDGWKDVAPREQPGKHSEESGNPGQGSPTLKQLYARRWMETPGRFARRPRAALWAVRKKLRPERREVQEPARPFVANPFEHRFNLLREHLKEVDLLITPSAFLRDQFVEHFGISSSRIIHSANGMDFSYVESLPKSNSAMLRFGFVGSIIKTKGVHVAVEAFLPVAEKYQDVELSIYGAPNRWSKEYLDELKKTVTDRGLGDRIRFRGRFDNRKIGQVLSDIDVLVVPSIWFENAPLTLNEAAMTRTPIIVSDRGGMLEFVEANDYGRTFELGNPESLTNVMMELAADRSRVTALAGNPPPIKPVAANADELIGIYERILAGNYTAPSLEEQTATRGGCVQGT